MGQLRECDWWKLFVLIYSSLVSHTSFLLSLSPISFLLSLFTSPPPPSLPSPSPCYLSTLTFPFFLQILPLPSIFPFYLNFIPPPSSSTFYLLVFGDLIRKKKMMKKKMKQEEIYN